MWSIECLDLVRTSKGMYVVHGGGGGGGWKGEEGALEWGREGEGQSRVREEKVEDAGEGVEEGRVRPRLARRSRGAFATSARRWQWHSSGAQ